MKNYEVYDDGIVVNLNEKSGTKTNLVKLQVVTDKVIHIIATAADEFSNEKSLMVVEKKRDKINWNLKQRWGKVYFSTNKINACISLKTGEIIFKDKKGEIILQEKVGGGKYFELLELEGKKYYKIRQIFESQCNEAFYGLGQYQHDEMNYKRKNVNLTQHNIVAVVPFLVSSKNYGMLWDNYSITKFGDIRDYAPVSELKLYSKDTIEGGLTATYESAYIDGKIYEQRIETKIDYKYNDSFENMPVEVRRQNANITWEGFIESDVTGEHEFLLYSSGYTKLWVNDELMIDCWRANWNPWSRKIYIQMEEAKKYPFKIEWLSQGGYIGLDYLSPLDTKEKNELSFYSEVADEINYYFIYGEKVDDIIKGYREITGEAPIMPKWAMGLWQCRERYKTQEELLSVVKEFRKRKIPLDNIVQDWRYWEDDKWGSHEFDPKRFPDPEGMINELHNKLNARIMISVWPKFYEGIENYKEFEKNGWIYPYNVEIQRKDWIGYVSSFYDAFSPGARKLFWDQMNRELFSKGIDAWWMDATEPDIQSNVSIEERKLLMSPVALGPSAKYFNAYSLMQSKGIYEGQMQTNPDKRVFILTRSAYAGQQRYAAATWSGDVASRWYDLKAQISAGINFSISGIPYWTTDIGGFSVESSYEQGKGMDIEEWREFMTRWFQFGAFCPLFRVHGQFPPREMYIVAPDDHIAYQSMLYYDKLRYRLMPYIYSLAGHTYHKSYTIMRALIMDFKDDSKVYNIGDQYMFGPSLLVCPVYEYKAQDRNVYLPASNGWYELYSGKYYQGGQEIQAHAPFDKIPVFVKEGSIIPYGPEIQYTTEKPADPLTLFIYTGNDASFDLYEDENINNNYLKGQYSIIPFKYSESDKVLTVGKRIGDFSGMLQTRTINVVWGDKDTPVKLNFDIKPDQILIYEGDELSIKMN